MVKLEVEVDTLDQLQLAAQSPGRRRPPRQHGPAHLARGCGPGRRPLPYRGLGRYSPETLPEIASAGVDIISLGWLTHSAPGLDIGLDLDPF